jgi:hypothetical protein
VTKTRCIQWFMHREKNHLKKKLKEKNEKLLDMN